MSEFLLELFSEEIPARMQADALKHLLTSLTAGLEKAGLKHGDPVGYVTPRRLAIFIEHIPTAQPDISTELKGPKLDAPPAALDGFLKKTGLSADKLEKRDGVYFAKIEQKGKPTPDVLKSLIEEILLSFPWPKSMRWGSGEQTWVRPLHSILCLFDNQVVPVHFAGVLAANQTRGHRFLSHGSFHVTRARDYEASLKKAHVIASRDERKIEIERQAEIAASSKKLTLKTDDALLEEVTGLVEWPVVLTGSIDAQFMELPPEVLTTVMRSHQKYFALQDKGGKLVDKFLIVANMETKDAGRAIVAGNERVLRARFSDARFFWDQDRKKRLSQWGDQLRNVTFHAQLGTMTDKTVRVILMALKINNAYNESIHELDKKNDPKFAVISALLCKSDLVTGMVGEFPELQGIMGRYYAIKQGEALEIANAIRDHYKPLGPSDSVPVAPTSICVAIADKIDTIASLFLIGEKPTGSKDPYALRRAALGIIRIILENQLRINLIPLIFDAAFTSANSIDKVEKEKIKLTVSKLLNELNVDTQDYKKMDANPPVIEELESHRITDSKKVEKTKELAFNATKQIIPFIFDRLKVQLKDSGIRRDVIAAVVADGDDDLVRIVERAKALQAFLATPDGANLLAAYKRAANILAIEEKKDKITYKASDLAADALKEKEETELARQLKALSAALETLRKGEKFTDSMKKLAELRAPVDLFFEKIMVNCDDKELRANRLRLLSSIRGGMDSIASFALIEG